METKKSTFALYFYINKSRTDKENRCPIYLRITVNNTQTAVSIKRSIHPNYWDSKGFPKGKTQEIRDLNNYINAIRIKLFNVQEELMLKEDCITADMFRAALYGTKKDHSASIMELFQQQLEKEKTLYEKGCKSKTPYSMFFHCSTYFKSFLLKHHKVDDIKVKRIDKKMIENFIEYLKLCPDIKHNYSMYLLMRLKSILVTAADDELIPKNPFPDISLAPIYEGSRKYLTEEELPKLFSTKLKKKCHQIQLDMFLFSVFTGLSNVDVLQFKRENLEKMNGQWWIRVHREKTDVLSNIPLLPQAEVIIRKYKPEYEIMSFNEKIFPKMSLVCRNTNLKEIAKICGINKNLTTHVARHTFATTITLTNDVPLETVSKMLGHKSLRMTQHYAKIVDKKIGRDMDKLTEKLYTKFA